MKMKMIFSKTSRDVIAVAAGDKSALRRIYEKYRDEIYRYAYSILKNHQNAEDVLQDTMVRIAEKADTYSKGKEKSWIMRIVHNIAIDYIRGNSYEVPTADVTYIPDEKKDSFGDIIELIPDETDRQIVVLKLDVGFKIKEIAKMLTMTPNAVSKRYRRTLKFLKQKLKKS